jgi:hypothetical protein
LALNLIVVLIGIEQIAAHPHVFANWKIALFAEHGSPLAMIGLSLFLFPKLALGLSGFETGVSMMPLVKGAPEDQEPRPVGKIRHTHRVLLTAALEAFRQSAQRLEPVDGSYVTEHHRVSRLGVFTLGRRS